MLDLSFFQAAVIDGYTAAEGGNCFGAGVFTGPLQIFVKKNDLPNASILFSFTAKGDDGTTDVNYALRLFGVITTPNDWPPPRRQHDHRGDI